MPMSKLAEFKALEAQLAVQLQQLDGLKNDAALKQEIEFETQLRALLAEYRTSLKDIIDFLIPRTLPAPWPCVQTPRSRADRSSLSATDTRTRVKC